MNKNVIILGGGLSGLSAGITLIKEGYNPIIIEKNKEAGGLCSTYIKEDSYVDLCIHWITGTKNDKFRELYDIFSLFEDDEIIKLPYFYRFYYKDDVIEISRDINKFKEQLIKYATKKDLKRLKRFFYSLDKLKDLPMTTLKPMDNMKNLELLRTGLKYVKFIKPYRSMSKYSLLEYSELFESVILKEFFKSLMPSYYSFVYVCGLLSKFFDSKADILKITSQEFSNRLYKQYIELGGIIKLDESVISLDINNNMITKVITNKNSYDANYVINTTSLPYFYDNLLDKNYHDNKILKQIKDAKNNPILSAFMVAFKIDKNYNEEIPHYIIINNENNIKCANNINPSIGFRGYQYIDNLDGSHTLIAIVDQNYDDFKYWEKLNEEESINLKSKISNQILELLISKLPNIKDYIKILDIITPINIAKRYNAYSGSYLSNICTTHSTRKMYKFRAKNLDNLYLSGQWISTIGGIPIAIQNGYFAGLVLIKDDKKRENHKK